ncbi:TPA: hypothetical protein ACK3Q6_004428 [Burkholderia cepacia]
MIGNLRNGIERLRALLTFTRSDAIAAAATLPYSLILAVVLLSGYYWIGGRAGVVSGVIAFACGPAGAFVRSRLAPLSWFERLTVIARFIGDNAFVLIGIFLIGLWRDAPAVSVLPASAAIVYHSAEQVGAALFSLWAAWSAVAVFAGSYFTGGYMRYVRMLIERGVAYAAALVAIRYFSPAVVDLVRELQTQPVATLSAALGVLVILAVFFVVPKRANVNVAEAVKRFGQLVRPHDMRRTAVHEAGHALLYALLPKLPGSVKVKVRRFILPEHEEAGYVKGVVPWGVAASRSYLRWIMLVNLGGLIAQEVVYGDRFAGAGEDCAKWIGYATAYLTGGFGDPIFPAPKTHEEVEHNRLAFAALKVAHEGALREFFTVNRAVIDDLAERLTRDSEIDSATLSEYLSRVTFTADVSPLSEING